MLLPKIRVIKKKEGYIAIVSAVIITAIVIVIALVFSSSNFLGRFDGQSLEIKDTAKSVAEGCLAYARLKLALGSYSGNETRNIGSYSCTILPISIQDTQYVISSKSTVNNQTVNLKLTINKTTFATISLEEVSGF